MKKNLISFHINAIWPEWNRFKISALLFWQFTFTVDMIFNELPGEWWIHFTFKRLFFFYNWISLLWLKFYQGFCSLFNMKMNEINPSDDFFLFTINTIFSLFMWIFWNESGGKCLHIYIMINKNLACSFWWRYDVINYR